MDRQTIVQMAAQIAAAAETIGVTGEFNRVQLSGIYRIAAQIVAEAGRDEDDGG